MINGNSLSILERAINRYGNMITFARKSENKYHELTSELSETVTVKALYHAPRTTAQREQTDSTRANTGRSEMLTALYSSNIQPDDVCTVRGRTYCVTDVFDYDTSGKVLEISIEEVSAQ